MEKFSVLMPVYFKEDALHFRQALDSIIINQTVIPDEIVIVKDGPLTNELDKVIEEFELKFPHVFNIVALEKNMGMGVSFPTGVNACSNDYVFRMDSDDISIPSRFETQLEFLRNNPKYDLIGSSVKEFKDNWELSKNIRNVPQFHDDIVKKSKRQNPINHMTVLFRKSAVIRAGNYQKSKEQGFEDYHLWVRMLRIGSKFYNFQEPLCYARVGNDMIGRRHGFKYLIAEVTHFWWMKSTGYLNFKEFIFIIIVRPPLRILPKPILNYIYKKFTGRQEV